MLDLVEDKARIAQLICDYLKETPVARWKFETLISRLLYRGLQIEPTDESLIVIGNLYRQQVVQHSTIHASHLSEEDQEKITSVCNSISTICVAKQIKLMLREAAFTTNYIEGLKNSALSSASTSQQHQQPQSQQSQQNIPFKNLNATDKMIALVNKYGSNGHLDLMTARIPQRMAPSVKKLPLHLSLKATQQERQMLIDIANCKGEKDVADTLERFYGMRQISQDCKFIRLALASSQAIWESKQLLNKQHNEDWYRMHVYSFVFDNAFINQAEFETKRSECYSNITKLFPDEKDQRIDFIFRNLNDDSDWTSSEEKPGSKGVTDDLIKGKALQKMMLSTWLKKLGSIKLLNKLEAITCQWEGTKLTIFATRTLTPGHTITYKKGSFSMPKSFDHCAELSKILLAVLSLRRHVLSNYKKMNLMLQEKQREEVANLDFDEDDEFNLKSDSTYDPDEYDLADDDNCSQMDPDLEAALLKEIQNIDDDEDLKSCLNWEEFIM